ncbi:glycoside hydrolase family 13 protein [Bifidobacterium mongoliense]|uniref:glycoside hydrolase family 13 protein n=1 Tax=Bifidobacterium mongoliense TaxID=518643 RepID=UPI003BEED4A2
MTDAQRSPLPRGMHANGALDGPWWANAVVYQVYPRSFQDSNNDGIGDIPGITSRLDYLADLGVDVLWLSPIYRSPQDDNGYDIADYRDVDPMFGTLYDLDELIGQAHARGIRIVMDLVVNHTSDEHAWFQASRRGDPQYADWYWWRPAKPGHTPGTPGAEPNNWGSDFGGSAWTYDPGRGAYYLHSFSRKQPDLNWENPAVRDAVYRMMGWWLDRGVDGFRMDVITLISKPVAADGTLPDGPADESGYCNSQVAAADGPRLDEFLAEMRSRVFDGREGFLTVGEAPGITPVRNRHITTPNHGELDMLFLFDHMMFDERGSKWNPLPLDLVTLKRIMRRYQEAVSVEGWNALFFNNHDQPRVVSRWGDVSTDDLRVRSAKALALVLHMHRGTPYIYQGEELGMTNAGFTSLSQYRDIESLSLYDVRVLEDKLATHEQMISALTMRSRDNARTPMPWDDSRYAGFTGSGPDDPGPWMEVNPNKDVINARNEQRDPYSVLAFYRRLIDLRHTDPVVSVGGWRLLDADDKRVYAFVRSLPVPVPGHRDLLVVANLSSHTAVIPPETAGLLGFDQTGFPSRSSGTAGISVDDVVLSTYPADHTLASLTTRRLEPWEAFIYRM